MRKIYPRKNELRVRSAFLIFPRTIKNEKRWLERATWEQICITPYKNETLVFWEDTQWIDDLDKYNYLKELRKQWRELANKKRG